MSRCNRSLFSPLNVLLCFANAHEVISSHLQSANCVHCLSTLIIRKHTSLAAFTDSAGISTLDKFSYTNSSDGPEEIGDSSFFAG